ncbi:MAG: SH3 domain-containing protein [Armatimonadetes bacterium]|nr:SH3 domain-containing protein [Anaerolineae bacterium]
MLDRSTNTLSTLLTYTQNQPINQQFPLIPLPSDSANGLFFGIDTADWNPVHQEWIALKIALGGEETTRLYANVLYNYATGDMISIDSILPTSTDAKLLWHPNGRWLVVNLLGRGVSLVEVFDSTGAMPLRELKTIDEINNETLLDWVGAGDLLLTTKMIDGDTVFYIAQIINQEWRSTEFFRIPDELFTVGNFDWLNTAYETENKVLTCIFDTRLAPRLQFGRRGRVAAASSSLRAEPGLRSAVLVEMAQGATFDVVEKPWCEDGYRWWQLQAADGTIGYAAESDTTQYFLEPAP